MRIVSFARSRSSLPGALSCWLLMSSAWAGLSFGGPSAAAEDDPVIRPGDRLDVSLDPRPLVAPTLVLVSPSQQVRTFLLAKANTQLDLFATYGTEPREGTWQLLITLPPNATLAPPSATPPVARATFVFAGAAGPQGVLPAAGGASLGAYNAHRSAWAIQGTYVDEEEVGEIRISPPDPGHYLPGNASVSLAAKPVVVAVLDTGINPYHMEFRDTARTVHPSTYIPGYPAGAQELRLTLDAPDYATARAADDATWDAAKFGKLYYVPGTKIVGAISFGTLEDGGPPVLDPHGHGTATSSKAVGSTLGGAPGALVVMVQFSADLFSIGGWWRLADWVNRQEWIDVVSMSFGMPANAYFPVLDFARHTKRMADAGKVVVAAAGNGVGICGGAPAANVLDQVSSPPWVVSVGATSPWNDQPVTWGSYPVDVVAQGDRVTVATRDSLTGTQKKCGTSFSAPFVAGAFAHAIAAARAARPPTSGPLADGVLGIEELHNVVLRSARVVSVLDSYIRYCAGFNQHCPPLQCEYGGGWVCAEDCIGLLTAHPGWCTNLLPAPPGAEFVVMGHGLVDGASREKAARVIAGQEAEPSRPVEDVWRASVLAVRTAVWAAEILQYDTRPQSAGVGGLANTGGLENDACEITGYEGPPCGLPYQ